MAVQRVRRGAGEYPADASRTGDLLNACRSPPTRIRGEPQMLSALVMKALFVPPRARSLITAPFGRMVRALKGPANAIKLACGPSGRTGAAADCSGVKLCCGTRATLGCWLRLHNLVAAELYETTFLDLA